MNASRIARRNAIEAKLCALRKTRDGIVISLVIHPADVPQDLMLADIGTRYMAALVPIGDDEQPASAEDEAKAKRSAIAKQRYAEAGEREKAVARAGMMSRDPKFWHWLGWMRGDDPDDMSVDRIQRAAAEFIRDRCGVESRTEIATNPDAFSAFLDLEWQFQHEKYYKHT